MPELPLPALLAADALAFSMVALLSFALGMIVTIFLIMARSGPRPSDVDTNFLEDEEKDDPYNNVEAKGDHPAETPRDLWEQDPDWWKK